MEYVSCLMYVVLQSCRGCCVQLMFLELAEGIWGLSYRGRKYSLETTSGTWFCL